MGAQEFWLKPVCGDDRNSQSSFESTFNLQICVRSSTFREASVATRSAPSFGKLSLMNMELIQPAHTMVIPICNWSASMCITMKRLEVVTCHAQSSWTSSQELW